MDFNYNIGFGILGGIIVLAILIVAVIVGLKRSSDKKAATKFLEGLGDKILEIVLNTIASISPGKYSSLGDFEADLIENIYNNVWDYVKGEVEQSADVDNITKAVFKLVDKEFVVNFIDFIFEQNGIQDKMINAYGSYYIKNNSSVEEDNALVEEYSDQTEYVETFVQEELPVAEEFVPTEEETATINPPVEEESETVDIEDESVEVIVEKREIVATTDRNGNTIYYELDVNGKKRRVSKEYALANM